MILRYVTLHFGCHDEINFFFADSSLPCRDPCSGVSISGAQNCTVSYCCLNSDNVCVLRQLPVGKYTLFTIDITFLSSRKMDFLQCIFLKFMK